MKSMRFAALVVSLVCAPALAFAHGASRLKLTESVEINVQPRRSGRSSAIFTT